VTKRLEEDSKIQLDKDRLRFKGFLKENNLDEHAEKLKHMEVKSIEDL
jgi:hypothetical protein